MRTGWWMAAALACAVGAHAGERLSLDTATAVQLASLTDVPADLATRIVELRTQRGGRLHSVEELRVIPGISEASLDSLRSGTQLKLELSVGATHSYSSASEVLDHFKHEPEIGQVQDWTSSYAKVQPQLVERWLAASRGFAALPQVRVAYSLDDDWQNNFRRYDINGNPPVSNDGQFSDVLTDADVGQVRRIDVWATWDLDRLVMSSEQIRVINEAQDVVKLREKVLGEVTRLYFERRRLQVDLLLNPKSDLLGQVRDELRLRELTANLDAFTGGRFSESIGSKPVSAPKP